MRTRLAVVVALVVSASGWNAGKALPRTQRADYVDVHMHLLGRVPPGSGGAAQPAGRGAGRPALRRDDLSANYEAAAVELIARMDRAGVRKTLVMPPPQARGQAGGYTHEEISGVVRAHADRLALAAGGGELCPIVLETDPAKVTPTVRSDFERQAEAIARAGARAFGEMVALHFSFSETHPFLQAPPDHPLFLLLADIAAGRGMAIDLHMEAVPEDQPLPGRLAGLSSRNPPVIRATIPAFERLLAHNRGARVVWQHVGWDSTGHQTPALLRRLLQAHSNLFLALKVTRVEFERFRAANIVDARVRVLPDWLALISEFPDRFVMGADEFIGPGKSAAHGPPSFDDTWSILAQLPSGVRAKVGRENAVRIYALR